MNTNFWILFTLRIAPGVYEIDSYMGLCYLQIPSKDLSQNKYYSNSLIKFWAFWLCLKIGRRSKKTTIGDENKLILEHYYPAGCSAGSSWNELVLRWNSLGLTLNSCLGGGGSSISATGLGGGDGGSHKAPRGSSLSTGVRGDTLKNHYFYVKRF